MPQLLSNDGECWWQQPNTYAFYCSQLAANPPLSAPEIDPSSLTPIALAVGLILVGLGKKIRKS